MLHQLVATLYQLCRVAGIVIMVLGALHLARAMLANGGASALVKAGLFFVVGSVVSGLAG